MKATIFSLLVVVAASAQVALAKARPRPKPKPLPRPTGHYGSCTARELKAGCHTYPGGVVPVPRSTMCYCY